MAFTPLRPLKPMRDSLVLAELSQNILTGASANYVSLNKLLGK
ncbi:hypothetical protein NP603_12325 [Methylomonas sp. SURF-1]|uniref:Uncharacterized protein n=1 Tax=Methylomonas aurea TaxID=2952224 RepID=A0ABT1UKE1_9GAMM|nr:hypothetical protein [Methylomonas sp. SURF-1]MCQ8181896.1 hypothetical protein [Methylomonas sp. SURF-1]